MTQEQELAIIRPWAAALPEKYDVIEFYCLSRGYNIFSLYNSSLLGHRSGNPVLAIISHVTNKPRLLNMNEVWVVMNT